MAKILLVEDDNNLREIYEARLQAEGYQIARAKDGEEALVVAKKERPDLIIADVMMPRVSGFEMLDIIRNTPELKEVHVIMLTALGQAEDKTRADSLGADRYLVKSQVTLEDIVKAAADVLAGAPAGPTPAAASAAPSDGATASPATPGAAAGTAIPVTTPVTPAPAPVEPPMPQLATPAPEPTAPPADASAAIGPPPAAAPSDGDLPVMAPPADSAAPPAIAPAAPADASTADSQLVADAVDDLIAGSAQAAPAPTPAPAPPPAAPAPTTSPQAPLTMEPVLTPPAPIAPPAAPPVASTPPPPAPANDVTIADNPANSRKAITPLPPGSSPSLPDLNELLAREGHDLGDTDSQSFSYAAHTPGNVISPGGAAATAPPDLSPPAANNPTPADPNSISL